MLKEIEIWECPDCGFEMNAIHVDDTEAGGHTCPACHEVNARKEVRWFAEKMELKLQENDHKGGWDDCKFGWLLERIVGETAELRSEIVTLLTVERGGIDVTKLLERIIKESADVANFAMMIADKANKRLSR